MRYLPHLMSRRPARPVTFIVVPGIDGVLPLQENEFDWAGLASTALKLSILIKSLLSLPLLHLGIVPWHLRKHSKGHFLILMYHRVIRPEIEESFIQAGMYVRPETFRMHLRFLKSQFRVVPLHELSFLEKSIAGSVSKHPFCAITFDDGWWDFYEEAFPALKEEGLPATVFLPTSYIGTNRSFWTDRLAILLPRDVGLEPAASETALRKHKVASKLLALKGTFESRLEQGIALLKMQRIEIIEEVLSVLSEMTGMGFRSEEKAFLSWDEVKEMRRSGLIHYGSHTINHAILTTLKEEEISKELNKSRERLLKEGVVDPQFFPFCYPNGDYTDKIAAIVREAEYSMALTTQKGWNDFGRDPYTLRRIGIHQDITRTESLFACRIANLF